MPRVLEGVLRYGDIAADTTGVGVTDRLIREPNANDVLLGRGQPLIRYSGNINFRRLCYKKQAHYLSMHRNAQKDNIARSIVHEVKRRGGRFLRRNGSKTSDVRVDVGHGWIEIDDASAIEKVKQTIRDNKFHLYGSKMTGKDDDTWDIPSSPIAAKRLSLRSSIPTDASPHVLKPAALLPPGVPASACQTLPGRRRVKLTETDGTTNHWTEGSSKTRGLVLETNGSAIKSRQQSFSIQALRQQPPFALQPHRLSDDSFHRQRMANMFAVLDVHSLTQIGQRGPFSSHYLDQLPSQYVRQQQITALPEYSHRSLALPPSFQCQSGMAESPLSYQDLLPGILADARQRDRPSSLTPEDVVLLHQGRSVALNRCELLRRIHQRPKEPVTFPVSLPGGRITAPHYRRPHHQQQQQQQQPQFDTAGSYSSSESNPLVNGKPPARPTLSKEQRTPDGRVGDGRMTNDSAVMMRKRQRKETDSPSSSTSSTGTLPLKKRAKRA